MTDFTISCPVGDEPLSPGNPNPSSKAKADRFDRRTPPLSDNYLMGPLRISDHCLVSI
jgi:hypothetical protein